MKKLAILASGAGSNARNIIQYFRNRDDVKVVLIASNKKDAGVLKIAEAEGIPTYILKKENFTEGDEFLKKLNSLGIDLVILAGFLKKVPSNITKTFENRIINIHPALLPSYGGHGMYGHYVHEAVFNNKDEESGITIHFVNEHYDEGNIIFQAKVSLTENDSAETIEQKVRELEIQHFPRVIDQLISV